MQHQIIRSQALLWRVALAQRYPMVHEIIRALCVCVESGNCLQAHIRLLALLRYRPELSLSMHATLHPVHW